MLLTMLLQYFFPVVLIFFMH